MDRSQFRRGMLSLYLESNGKLVKYVKQEKGHHGGHKAEEGLDEQD